VIGKVEVKLTGTSTTLTDGGSVPPTIHERFVTFGLLVAALAPGVLKAGALGFESAAEIVR
jgi:hypothetical protein